LSDPAIAPVGDLEPNKSRTGTWQIAFLGETEPRAARPGRDVPVSTVSRAPVCPAVNGVRPARLDSRSAGALKSCLRPMRTRRDLFVLTLSAGDPAATPNVTY
jgi:hypothetical protein